MGRGSGKMVVFRGGYRGTVYVAGFLSGPPVPPFPIIYSMSTESVPKTAWKIVTDWVRDIKGTVTGAVGE